MWERRVVEKWEGLMLVSKFRSISLLHPKSAPRTNHCCWPRHQSRACRRQLGAPVGPWRNMARVWYRSRCSAGARLGEWTSGPFLVHKPCASSTGFCYHVFLLIESSNSSYKRPKRVEWSRRRRLVSTGPLHWHKVWISSRVRRYEWREASSSPIESAGHASPVHLPLVTTAPGLSLYLIVTIVLMCCTLRSAMKWHAAAFQ